MRIDLVIMHIANPLLVVLAVGWITTAEALVDMRTANYTSTWYDVCLGPCETSKLERTYNSRTIHDGIFGYGWCSNIETSLENIRGELSLAFCGAGKRVVLRRTRDVRRDHEGEIDAIIRTVNARNAGRQTKAWNKNEQRRLTNDLRGDDFLFEMFLKNTGMARTPLLLGSYASEDGRTVAVVRNDDILVTGYGEEQYRFDRDLNLVGLRNPNGARWQLARQAGEIRIQTDQGQWLLALSNYGTVRKVTGPTGVAAEYRYEMLGSKPVLTRVLQESGNEYKYTYADHDHPQLTRIDYPDGTFVLLAYSVEEGWVTSFRDRRGCMEQYSYLLAPIPELVNQITFKSWDVLQGVASSINSGPNDVFASTVTKTCDGRIANRSHYLFIHRTSVDRGTVLAATASNRNGSETLSLFDELGRVVSQRRDPYFELQVQYAYVEGDSRTIARTSSLVTGRSVRLNSVNCKRTEKIQGLLGANLTGSTEVFSAHLSFSDFDAKEAGRDFLQDAPCLPVRLEWQARGAGGAVEFHWHEIDAGSIHLGKKLTLHVQTAHSRDNEQGFTSWLNRCTEVGTTNEHGAAAWNVAVCTLEERVTLGALMLFQGGSDPLIWSVRESE